MSHKKNLIAAAALALAATAAQAETNILLFGTSHHVNSHMGHAKGYNEVNPGLGLEWGKEPWWYVGALTYRDSYYKQAYAAYGGVRGKVDLGYDFHLEGGLRLGYLNGSGWHGAMVMPTIGVGYKNVAMELTFLPPVNSGKAQDGVIALWLRFTL
ncbi:hypothetical protein [Cupriavidus campinensis]|uniref:Uncharacterized protein n=1 Tax=Cupriavidus campinensis TaxID=151783 RepID=A0ABY3ETG8_9BURK|nr:hypothetical protein [Cupriavidus campinensis]TSP14028.1 hypothetical protein FGG12_06035 [Cupriavidus campinensis]